MSKPATKATAPKPLRAVARPLFGGFLGTPYRGSVEIERADNGFVVQVVDCDGKNGRTVHVSLVEALEVAHVALTPKPAKKPAAKA